MTDKQLNELGFDRWGTNRIWHGDSETEMVVNDLKKIKPKDLISRFYTVTYQTGIVCGIAQKMNEIKRVIGVIDPET